jgi:quercetin dioxygenase-like cupin family protein
MRPPFFLLLLSLLLASAATVAGAGADPITVETVIATDKTVLGQPLALPQREAKVIVTILEIAPGARLPRHMHPFQRYA